MDPHDLEALTREAERARRRGRLAEARRSYETVVQEARRQGDVGAEARALRELAELEREGRDDHAAARRYREAVERCREAGDLRLLAHTVRHLGDVLRGLGALEEAEDCYVEALELYRERATPSPGELANAVRPLAILRDLQARSDEARALWAEARDLYREAGIEAGVEECEDRLMPRGG